MTSLLVGVKAHDPVTFFAEAGVPGLVAMVACLAPAARATRIDPMTALRAE